MYPESTENQDLNTKLSNSEANFSTNPYRLRLYFHGAGGGLCRNLWVEHITP